MSSLTDDRVAAVSLFLLFAACCLFVAMLSSSALRDGSDDFFAHSSRTRPWRQGIALTGDFVSGAGVLCLCAVVAAGGYDGVLVVAAAAFSPLLLKVWLAERLPVGPGWSLGDVFARRLPPGPARVAAAVVTLAVCLPLLVAQLVPVGRITAALTGLPGDAGETTGIVLVGASVCACASTGGVGGARRLQVVKALAFLVAAPVLALLVLARFGWNYGELLDQAARGSGAAGTYLAPGGLLGTGLTGRLDTLSLALTVLLGAAFLPHLVIRLSAGSSSNSARRATSWAVSAVCVLCACAVVLGYGARALGGTGLAGAVGGAGGPLPGLLTDGAGLAREGAALPPGALLTAVACAVFLTVLASASVMLLAGTAAVVRDLGRQRHVPAGRQGVHSQLRARAALVALGAVCVALAVAGRSAGAGFWLTLAYTEAATAVLPALGYGLLWRRFTLRGLRWSVYGGTLTATTLFALSPAVSGGPYALFPAADWSVFPLHAPGLVSIPAAFLLGAAGSLTGRLGAAVRQRQQAPASPPGGGVAGGRGEVVGGGPVRELSRDGPRTGPPPGSAGLHASQ